MYFHGYKQTDFVYSDPVVRGYSTLPHIFTFLQTEKKGNKGVEKQVNARLYTYRGFGVFNNHGNMFGSGSLYIFRNLFYLEAAAGSLPQCLCAVRAGDNFLCATTWDVCMRGRSRATGGDVIGSELTAELGHHARKSSFNQQTCREN